MKNAIEYSDKPILPMWFRVALVMAVIMTLFYSMTHRLADNQGHAYAEAFNHGEKIRSQRLYFEDLDHGGIRVIDADTQQAIELISKGEDGFMRGVLRGLVRERKAKNIGAEIPFELAVWEDGLVSLLDPATDRRVELSAFGKDNVAAFTRFLVHQDTRQLGTPS